MIIFPFQSFGAGDIIFTQTLVKKIANGNKILWGVEPHFVEGLNRAYPDVFFVDKSAVNVDYNIKEDCVVNGLRILPIRWADYLMKVPYTECMKSKYSLYGQDWRTWRECSTWNRTIEREQSLYEKLGLTENQEYTLVNRFFGSESQCVSPIPKRGIEMCTIEGYSLFDWTKVIENATHIHTVSTSIIYLLEMLELKAKEVHLYVRKGHETNFDNVNYILEKHKHIFHYNFDL